MIRWPRDALIFSVRCRGCGVYAAGYVEGDTITHELLAARMTTSAGLELVGLRTLLHGWTELEALRAQPVPGIAAVLDAFVPLASLQPESVSTLPMQGTVVVVEALPGCVHAGDLVRRLFRMNEGAPPVGLALRVVRDLASIWARAPVALKLTRRIDNVLLGWDGAVHVQPRVGVSSDDGVEACGHHLLRFLTGEVLEPRYGEVRERLEDTMRARFDSLPYSVPSAVRGIIELCLRSALPLDQVITRLDAALVDEPFSRADLAGVLAQLFAQERADDLSFREELGACDLDALTLPDVRTNEATLERFAVGTPQDPMP